MNKGLSLAFLSLQKASEEQSCEKLKVSAVLGISPLLALQNTVVPHSSRF